MIAWVFPGQGSQQIGMAGGLRSGPARETFAEASEVLSWDVAKACDAGPPERLDSTEVTQPAVFIVSIAAARSLEARGLRPEAVAGHSVGELTAMTVAGSIRFEDALRAVAARGTAMRRAGRAHPGGMAAVVGLSAARVEELCAEASGLVGAANLNGPEQVVISGENTAIADVAARVREEGGRVIRLKVSVAAHSPLMGPVRDVLADALRDVSWSPPHVPFFSSVTGRRHDQPDELVDLAVRGVTEPVRWMDAVHAMGEEGVDMFVEVGPGTVLSGLIRRIAADAETVQAGDDAAIESLAERLAVVGGRSVDGHGN
jgi:[acyl-carrier-protein] S-malonyltransferase